MFFFEVGEQPLTIMRRPETYEDTEIMKRFFEFQPKFSIRLPVKEFELKSGRV